MVCAIIADVVPASTSDAAGIAIVLLGLGVVLSLGVAHRLAKLQYRLSSRREQTASRSLQAFGFGCVVFVLGLVLTSTRPFGIQPSSFTTVPPATATPKSLANHLGSSEPAEEAWDGTYVGSVHNASAGLNAKISINIQRQNKLAITGYFFVARPLYGSGPVQRQLSFRIVLPQLEMLLES
jgi:hypothetical protein